MTRDADLDAQIRRMLKKKPAVPRELEAVLFGRAEGLLAARREMVLERKQRSKRVQAKARGLLAKVRETAEHAFDTLAGYPDTSAVAATVAALLLAFLVMHGGSRQRGQVVQDDLAFAPRLNDASARYDAQRNAEQQAYEREVEDAHQQTSGGI